MHQIAVLHSNGICRLRSGKSFLKSQVIFFRFQNCKKIKNKTPLGSTGKSLLLHLIKFYHKPVLNYIRSLLYEHLCKNVQRTLRDVNM